ncbi:Uncharacterized protein FKW44_015269, partial [Caligus rogercresseyi]
ITSLGNSSSLVSVNEILSLVERTAMDEGECQHLIDALLNKQEDGGKASWVQNTGSASSLQSIQKHLSERESELSESRSSVKSLSDKLGQLRIELNASNLLSNNSSRLLEDMRSKHEKEKAALAQDYESRAKEVSGLQSKLNAQLSLTQELEAKLKSSSDLESLTTTNQTLNAQVEALRAKETQMEETLAARESKEAEVLKAHEEEVKRLQERMDDLKQVNDGEAGALRIKTE